MPKNSKMRGGGMYYRLQQDFHQEQVYPLEDACNNSLVQLFGTKKTNMATCKHLERFCRVITIVDQIDSLTTNDTILLCNSILNSKCWIKCQVVQLVMIRWNTITINTLKATRDLQVFLIPTALLTCFPGSSVDESVKQKSWRRRKTYLPWNQPTLHILTISKYFRVNLS